MKRKSAKEQSDYVDAILSGHVTKKPWIGLTPSETEIFNIWLSGAGAAEAIEQVLKERNDN